MTQQPVFPTFLLNLARRNARSDSIIIMMIIIIMIQKIIIITKIIIIIRILVVKMIMMMI